MRGCSVGFRSNWSSAVDNECVDVAYSLGSDMIRRRSGQKGGDGVVSWHG